MSRFIHIRVPSLFAEYFDQRPGLRRLFLSNPAPKGGATVLISPRENDPFHVDVQATLCHPNDMFCRKTGREAAAAHVAKRVPLGMLHRELQNVQKAALRLNGMTSAEIKEHLKDFSFVVRNFLPKE